MRLAPSGTARAVACTVLAMIGAAPATAQVFDNSAVIALQKAGLGEGSIMAKVGSLPCGYDVSTGGLVSLKQAGVPDGIITAMVERCSSSSRAQGMVGADGPTAAHAPGIYLSQDWLSSSPLQVVRPSRAGAVKVSGNGSILLPLVSTLVIPDDRSGTVVKNRRPTFFFYFEPTDRKVGDFGMASTIAAQSPSEFTLVRLKPRKGAREVSIGKVSALSARSGMSSKAAIDFRVEEIGDSSYKVGFDQELAPGEYGFVLTGANNAARVYDFTVP